MIASLRGQLKAIRDGSVIVDVGGVGYLVHVTSSLLSESPASGQIIELYTHTHVRENELALYGFRSLEELDLFLLDCLLDVLHAADSIAKSPGLSIRRERRSRPVTVPPCLAPIPLE